MKTNKHANAINLTPKDSGIIFTIACFTALIISAVASLIIISAFGEPSDTNKYDESFVYKLFSYGISGIAIIVSILIFRIKNRVPFFSATNVKPFKIKYLFAAFLLSFGFLFGLSSLNNIFIGFLSNFGYNAPEMTLPQTAFWQYLVWVVIVCVMPSILEETLFRGYILGGMRNCATWVSVILCGFLFSIYHQNPQQTIYQFITGAVFCLLTLKADSLLPSVIMHFINNFFVITVDKFFADVPFFNDVNVPITVIAVAVFIATVIWLIFQGRKRNTAKLNGNQNNKKNEPKNSLIENADLKSAKGFFSFGIAGIFICVFMWVANLIVWLK